MAAVCNPLSLYVEARNHREKPCLHREITVKNRVCTGDIAVFYGVFTVFLQWNRGAFAVLEGHEDECRPAGDLRKRWDAASKVSGLQ
jgi:hypothetical protein